MNDANNLTNVLVHEKGHVDNNNAGVENTLFNHAKIYANEINDPTFSNTTADFKTGVVSSFANYINERIN